LPHGGKSLGVKSVPSVVVDEDSVDARSAKAKGEREGDASGERGQGVLAQREFT